MTTKKDVSVKLYRLSLVVILILVIAVIVIAAVGYKIRGGDSKQQSEKALNQLLSCTLQQAEDFEAAAAASLASAEAEADRKIGLTQVDDQLRDYLEIQFGDSMTEECIEDLAMNRTFYRSIALAKDFHSDIDSDKVTLTKRSGEGECYTFSAEIKTAAGNPAANANGTIFMIKDGGDWKASRITLNMSEACN